MDWRYDPNLVLYLPLYELDGASFMSRDAYGHLCTVTGATWGIQGRSFDGVDDYIEIPDAASLNFGTGDFSLETWIYPHSVTEYKLLLGKWVDWTIGGVAAGYALYTSNDAAFIFIADGAAQRYGYSAAGTIIINTWQHIVAGRVSGAPFIHINGVNMSLSLGGAGNFAANIDNAIALRLGWEFTSTRRFDGVMGEVCVYNRVLTPLEIQRNSPVTKWRYQ